MAQAGDEATAGGEVSAAEADQLRATERARLRALVEVNLDAARELHAGDFQLINPSGQAWSKERYLGAVATGEVNYLVWEPVSPIEVRLHGTTAVIRYRSQVDIIVGAQHLEPHQAWHTDTYERRDGRWQVVWSQATRIVAE